MMRNFFFILFLLAQQITHAQFSPSLFLCSFIDRSNNDIVLSSNYTLQINRIENGEYILDENLKITFLEEHKMALAIVPQQYSEQQFMLQINHSVGNFTEVMNITFNTAKENELINGCYHCICTDILFQPGNFIIDMPTKKESWALIPDITQIINGTEVKFEDISFLQNWLMR